MSRRFIRGIASGRQQGGQHTNGREVDILLIDDAYGIGVYVNDGQSQRPSRERAEELLDKLIAEIEKAS